MKNAIELFMNGLFLLIVLAFVAALLVVMGLAFGW